MQTSLFNNTISEKELSNLKLLAKAKGDKAPCYQSLRGLGYSIGGAIWFIVNENLFIDWKKIWDEFERHGVINYCDITICDKQFNIIEYDGLLIMLNDTDVLSWSPEDVFDKKMKAKIRHHFKTHILENQYQFGLK